MTSNILFYSKYSQECEKLFNLIQKGGIDITRMYNITPICVDHRELRTKLLSNKKLPVTYVPTLLLFRDGGTVEKYEGEWTKTWFRENILKINPNAFNITQIDITQKQEDTQEIHIEPARPVKPVKPERPEYVPQSLKNNPPKKPRQELPQELPSKVEQGDDEELADIDDILDDEYEEKKPVKPNGKIDIGQVLARAQSAQQERQEKFGYKEK